MANFFKYRPIYRLWIMSLNPSPRSFFAVFCRRFLLTGTLNKIASFGSIFLRLWITLWHKLSHIVLKLRRVSILDPWSYLLLLKPNYIKKQWSSSSFFLPKIIIKVQNGNVVLNRLVPCLKCTLVACWILQVNLDLYYYLR